jgi:uncharacterized protein (TIGR00268 family)
VKETTMKKADHCREIISKHTSVLVALSGGVDSSVLLALAAESVDTCGAVTVVSDFITRDDLEYSEKVVRSLGVPHQIITLDLLAVDEISRNEGDRCYYCKHHMFRTLLSLAKEKGYERVLEGSNLDDREEYRPGMRALSELEIKSPFLEAGIGKEELRELARVYDLPAADRPSSPCLATRISHQETITLSSLAMVREAEEYMEKQGYNTFRVRKHGGCARIEVSPDEMDRLVRERLPLIDHMIESGFDHVALDLHGYRRGSMEQTLEDETDAT